MSRKNFRDEDAINGRKVVTRIFSWLVHRIGCTALQGQKAVLNPHPHIVAWRIGQRFQLATTDLARLDFGAVVMAFEP